MSFSKDVKEEVSKLNNLKDKEGVNAEFIGYLLTNNVTIVNNKIRFSTENEYNINRFNKLLNNMKIDYNIEMQGSTYVITFKKLKNIDICMYESNFININKEKTEVYFKGQDKILKAIVRGSFLGGGSISNPNKTYHLEIVFSSKDNAIFLKEVLNIYDVKCKELQRKDTYSLYIKDGEEISKFLALIGASASVLKFEEIRVLRDMKNNVNRIVNCETANLNKIVNTAVKQIDDIKIIKKKGKFKDLPKNLQEIANLRIENPDISLHELGQMLEKPIGKSGANYRLKKIQKIADELRKLN